MFKGKSSTFQYGFNKVVYRIWDFYRIVSVNFKTPIDRNDHIWLFRLLLAYPILQTYQMPLGPAATVKHSPTTGKQGLPSLTWPH